MHTVSFTLCTLNAFKPYSLFANIILKSLGLEFKTLYEISEEPGMSVSKNTFSLLHGEFINRVDYWQGYVFINIFNVHNCVSFLI